MTAIISFINLKGGVGKTTSAVAIAEFLSLEQGKRVLVVDLDPQTNATIALIAQEKWRELDDAGQTLLQLFKDKLDHTTKFDINRAIIRGVSNLCSGIPSLSLLPSSLGLIEIQDRLGEISSGAFFSISPVDILRDALRPILDTFDYVIVDCPPNLGVITLNGIAISTGYVIPVIPDILSTYGLPQITGRIEKFSKIKGVDVPAKGVIISKYRVQSRLHVSTLEELKRKAAAGELPAIFTSIIPESAKIAESADVSADVNTLRQKYGYSGNYEVYSGLAQEFMTKCH
jgi:chromosome partitioning protein